MDTGFAFPKSGHQALWQTIVEVNKQHPFDKDLVSGIRTFFHPSKLLLLGRSYCGGGDQMLLCIHFPTQLLQAENIDVKLASEVVRVKRHTEVILYCCIIRSNLAKSHNNFDTGSVAHFVVS